MDWQSRWMNEWTDGQTDLQIAVVTKSQLGDMFPEHMCSPLPKIVWSLLISVEVIYPLYEVNCGQYYNYQANDLVGPSELDIVNNTQGR